MLEFVNRNPDERELRKFGWSLLIGSVLVGAVFWYRGSASRGLELHLGWTGGPQQWIACFFWGLGFITCLLSRVHPPASRPVYLVWMTVMGAIGTVVTRILLAAVFYFMITPIGLWRRRGRRDPIDQDWEDDRESFWHDLKHPRDKRLYEKQY